MKTSFFIREYRKETSGLVFNATLAGLGKNSGTWDCNHSRPTAYKYAKELREKYPQMIYKVETL